VKLVTNPKPKSLMHVISNVRSGWVGLLGLLFIVYKNRTNGANGANDGPDVC
jgi:hypothetical protein